MAEFLDAILLFPTAIFTALLALVVGYWLMVVVGALDLNLFDGLDAATDALDVSTDGSIGGADEGGGSGHGLLDTIGLKGMPVTVWASVVVLVGWVVSLLGMQALAGTLGPLAAPVVGLLALVAGVVVAAVALRPLRPAFATHTAISHRALVGKTCTVTTLRVDESFGQALIDDGAAGLLVQVRSSDANDLTRGCQALIFDYNPEEGAFHVARYDEPAVDRHG